MVADKLTWNRWNFSPLAMVAVTNAILVGVILICLGLMALYVGSIHGEVQNRPLFVIRRKAGKTFLGNGDGPSR
jgi:polyisoprenyl-phosphate glycosyltransferase